MTYILQLRCPFPFQKGRPTFRKEFLHNFFGPTEEECLMQYVEWFAQLASDSFLRTRCQHQLAWVTGLAPEEEALMRDLQRMALMAEVTT